MAVVVAVVVVVGAVFDGAVVVVVVAAGAWNAVCATGCGTGAAATTWNNTTSMGGQKATFSIPSSLEDCPIILTCVTTLTGVSSVGAAPVAAVGGGGIGW